VGGVCSTHDRDKCLQHFISENLKGRKHLENIGVNGKIILDGSSGSG